MSKVFEGFPLIEEGKVILVRSQNTGQVGKYRGKCKHIIEGNLCGKNQHGCIEQRRLASIECRRKELCWSQIF